jgi:molybdate transport system ATP-binding protein
VLEFALNARRGKFHLEISCRLSAEWTVVFGPSGAGKSMLLRLLAGLDRPDRGHVAFHGSVLTDTASHTFLPPGKRRCALVTQQPALFPHMRVADNVLYGIRSGKSAAAWMKQAEEALELAGASGLIRRYPRELSGGEAQRVALARAIAVEPELLLLDEPFSALDGTAADALLDRLRPWLAMRKVQAVMVTHDATDAFTTGAEVLLLKQGRVIAQGPAAHVLAEERERLLGHLRMS